MVTIMTQEDHFRKLERMYLGAQCNEYYEPRMELSKGNAKLIIPVRERFFHSGSAVHGSVYFKALDDAAFFAANSLVEEVLLLTVQFSVYFIAQVSEGEISATGRVIQNSGRFLLAESFLSDGEGKEIARGSGMFVRSRIKLSPDVGYL